MQLATILSCLTVIFLYFSHDRITPKDIYARMLQQMNQLSESSIFGKTEFQVNKPLPGFLLDSMVCKIPDIDPFDPRAKDEVCRRDPLICTEVSISYNDGQYLRINRTLIDLYFKEFEHCKYKPITRHEPRDNAWKYGEESKPFTSDFKVTPEIEYMKVVCYSKTGVNLTTNLHAFITAKPEVEKRCEKNIIEHKKKHQPKEIFNVQLIGVDSTSRLNFMRNMVATREYLQNELNAYEMSGYNKVEDNTFVNIVPFLTGNFVFELGWNETMRDKEFDDYHFIWHNFTRAGYRTLYSEDAPYMSMFNYAKEGFHKPPGDYYQRAFMKALEHEKDFWYNKHSCFVDKHETNILLDHVTAFSKFFKDKPNFGFTFISRLTHDAAEHARYADFMYLDFLKKFKAGGHFNNTVLIFFSDHGPRFSSWRKTYIGRFEERLPFNYIVFPEWFPKKYPELDRILRINSKRLTSPFDMYETLKDILYFDGVSKVGNLSSRGISVLREIPKDRKCEHCGIAPHWCLCMEQDVIPNDSEIAIPVGKALVAKLNEMLSIESEKCAELSFEKIVHITRMKNSEKVLRFDNSKNDVLNKVVSYGKRSEDISEMYQLSLITKPGLGEFEATVTYDPKSKSVKLEGQVSRVNMYGKQSICVDNVVLKKICYCKMYLNKS